MISHINMQLITCSQFVKQTAIWMDNIISTMKSIGQSLGRYTRIFIFRVLLFGPIPNHVAFIMDGNRRYAKKKILEESAGYKAGFLSLMSMLKYCNELGVKYITFYAFAIDNFRRRPEEVGVVMSIMEEKIQGLLKQENFLNQHGVRIYFIGNLKLLNENVRVLAEKAMRATAKNSKCTLLTCVSYSSSDDISQAVQKSYYACCDKIKESNCSKFEETQVLNKEMDTGIKPIDIKKHMYMGVAPDPDILIRTSGQTRLSNFLQWETTNTLLLFPKALWPEFGLWHLVWAVLGFQRNYAYFNKKKKLV